MSGNMSALFLKITADDVCDLRVTESLTLHAHLGHPQSID